MTTQNELQPALDLKTLGKCMAQGAAIAFALVVIFFTVVFFTSKNGLGIGNKVFIPMLTVSGGGACGGLFYHLMGYVRVYGGLKKIAANIISLLVYVIGFWMGLVYGLSLIGLWD